jgi:outer membrane protein OmpA-like peptidoglycan-associated protein
MKKTITFLALGVMVLTACTTPGKRTAIGAGVGAAGGALAGAIIANNTGGKSEQGAIYGALAGAAIGGGIGNYYDKQAKELAKIADVKKTENGLEVTLKNDILFVSDSYALTDKSNTTLSELTTVLKKYPQNIIVVEGHTDSTGSAAHNQTLSENRAQAVYNYVVGHQLKTSSITFIGYGSTQPVADNSTEAGRAQNRRVNLKITANPKLVK